MNASRRTFILGTAGVALLATTAAAAKPLRRNPFTLGVASGDPTPDGFVLWARLAPAPLDTDGLGGMPDRDVPVEWQVSTTDKFATVAASGSVTARRAEAHSVHVEPVGLAPGREYFYRFRADGHVSPVGRTRTAPAAGTTPASLQLAFASCARFEQGWYHAYRFLAQDRPDLVLFLGDYLYESVSKSAQDVRGYVIEKPAETLAEYRHRYAHQRTDPALQAAHAAAPWICVLDDHELKNNWAGADPARPPAGRRAAAFQAYYENMPLRSSARPNQASMRIYRRCVWGNLAQFHMLDTRQFRSRIAADGDCADIRSNARTITGAAEEKWLLSGFAASTARWDLLGQQVFFAQRDSDGVAASCDVSTDSWDGYPASRQRITRGWVDLGVRNPVVLTGDVHRHWAAEIKMDYWSTTARPVGTELVTTSITSENTSADPSERYLRVNPHLRYVANQRGYVRARITPAEMTSEFVTVSSVHEPAFEKVTASVAKRFTVLDRERKLHDA